MLPLLRGIRFLGKRGVWGIVVALSIWNLFFELVLVPTWLGWRVVPSSLLVQTTLRGLCVCFALANWSACVQADGLAGATGLFPLATTLHSLSLWVNDYPRQSSHNMAAMFLTRCTLWMLRGSTMVMHTRIAIMVALVGIAMPNPPPVVFAYLYLNYYATRRVLPEMFSLQWDALLCESGVLGIVLASAAYFNLGYLGHAALLLFKLLAFRLFFGSGLVKLTSGDMAWRQCTALSHHFLTQPLPGRLAPTLHAMDKE